MSVVVIHDSLVGERSHALFSSVEGEIGHFAHKIVLGTGSLRVPAASPGRQPVTR